MVAYLDVDTANDEINNNYNKKVMFRFNLNKNEGSFLPLYNEFTDNKRLSKVLFNNAIITIN